ncbi:MAG TPA: alpha/beta fold hydrolase [Clostridiales bacterium]|nr:alpha/beta fold hydrolase [Clostridiales bacterium]
MIKEEITFPSSEAGETIFGEIFLPYGEVKGIVQFAHGMCDYGSRYGHLFKELTDHGYVAAYADHLGHGHSVADPEDLGYFSARDGHKKIAADFNTFYELLDEKFPNEKHYIMGHSMGSFVVRYFMGEYRHENMAGAILMGTCGFNPLAGVGAAMAAVIALIKGGYYRSTFLENLAFGKYNKRIEEPVSFWDWLSRDEAAVEGFDTDDLRNRTFTAAGFKDLFTFVNIVNSRSFIEETPRELPILILSGEEDPLGEYGKGIRKLEGILEALDFSDVTVKLFPEARHELCHELNCYEVFDTILLWLSQHANTEVCLTFPAELEDPFEDDFPDDEDKEIDTEEDEKTQRR